VDHKTVAKLRENSWEIPRDPESPQSEVRKFSNKKGTVSKINTENIGKPKQPKEALIRSTGIVLLISSPEETGLVTASCKGSK
jgi:hypothetical protein